VSIIDLCLCLDEQVDALLLAGGLHDGDQASMKTARFLAEQILWLHDAGIVVFALSRISRDLTIPDSVRAFGGRAETVAFDSARGGFPSLSLQACRASQLLVKFVAAVARPNSAARARTNASPGARGQARTRNSPTNEQSGGDELIVARLSYAAAVIALTLSGAKNAAGDIVPAFIRAKSSIALWLP
jgi:hypothetical protein